MPDLKVIKTRDDAWEACLALWKELAAAPSNNMGDGIKGRTLERLGYAGCRNDCPMCEYSMGIMDGTCKSCPLVPHYNCGSLFFVDWAAGISERGCHDQAAAKAFYKELLVIARKDGYLSKGRSK